MHRRCVGQQAQPAKRVNLFEFGDRTARCTGPAYAVKAVAAGDKVTFDLEFLAVFLIRDARLFAVEIMHGHVVGFVHGGQPGRGAGIHQVFGQLGLAINHDVFATGKPVHVHPVAFAVVEHFDTAVHQTLFVHALAHASFVQQVDAYLLQNAGADAREHVVASLAFQNDRVDTGLVQQLAEQQARRACTDDGNLGTHEKSPW